MRKSVPTTTVGEKAVIGVGVVIVVVLIVALCTLPMGWLLSVIAAHFGYHQPLWIWCAVWFVLAGLFGMAKGGSKE